MRSIEIDGDTIDEAIEAALRTLSVERDRVEVEILMAPARGMFGFGGRKARIRATVRAPLFSSFDDMLRPPVSRETAEVTQAAVPRREPTEPERRPDDLRATETRRRVDGGRAAAGAGASTARAERQQTALVPPTPAAERRAVEVLRTIIQLVGVEGDVDARPGVDPGTTVLAVKGNAGALLIGHRGQTLDALEYMVNRIVGREDDGAGGRLVVDVEGYRERRREYLRGLAQRLADKAKQTGRVVTLNPMTPRDRRIVHLALQDDTGVTTRSQGDGHLRKILILPSAGRRRRPALRPDETESR